MSQVTLNFTRAEYDQRLAKTRAAMAERGLDLLIVTDPSNMAWLTGKSAFSAYFLEDLFAAEQPADEAGAEIAGCLRGCRRGQGRSVACRLTCRTYEPESAVGSISKSGHPS